MATSFIPGIFVEFGYRGRAIRFFVRNVADVVQAHHANGVFYEQDHLEIIARFLKPGGVFLDVGSNVGNHAIFVAKFCQPSRVVVIEPNPQALVLLRLNLLLNQVDVDQSHLGVGLSDQERNAKASAPANNLGAARMIHTEDGPLKLVTGDSLFAGQQVDFIKIDVEGQEMAALAGLEQTISQWRPSMFVEVDEENRADFTSWMAAHAYEVAHAFPRYRNQNFVIVPKALEAQSPAS